MRQQNIENITMKFNIFSFLKKNKVKKNIEIESEPALEKLSRQISLKGFDQFNEWLAEQDFDKFFQRNQPIKLKRHFMKNKVNDISEKLENVRKKEENNKIYKIEEKNSEGLLNIKDMFFNRRNKSENIDIPSYKNQASSDIL